MSAGWQHPVVAEMVDPDRAEGAVRLVVAEPGTGKTWLVRETVKQARAAGYVVLHASGAVHDAAHMEAPFLGLIGDASPAAITDWLRRTARTRPILYAVDDIDRTGPECIDTVLAMIGTLRRHRVAVLMTATSAVGQLARVPRTTLAPLTTAAATEYLRTSGDPVTGRDAAEILRWAKGNPRALFELAGAVRAGPAMGAPRIRLMYADRLAALPPATRRALLYAAGRMGEEPLATVRRALTRGDTAASSPDAGVWSPAVAASMIEYGEDVRFRDPLIAVAAYWSAPAVVRRQVHQDYAAVLDEASFERAVHEGTVPLGPDRSTASVLEAASRAAVAEGRIGQAARAAHRAAELHPDRDDAARSYALAGLAAAAAGDAAWVDQVAPQVRYGTELPELRCAAASATALALSRRGLQAEAMEVLTGAAADHPPADKPTALGLAACATVVALDSGLPGHRAAARALLRSASVLPPGARPAPFLEGAAEVHRAAIAVRLGVEPPSAHRVLLRAASAGDGTRRRSAAERLSLADLADACDEPDAAIALRWDVLMGPCAEPAAPAYPEEWPQLAGDLIVMGRWAEADEVLDRAEALAATHALPLLRVKTAAVQALLLTFRGDPGAARALAESVWPLLDLSVNHDAHLRLVRALGFAALAAGDTTTGMRNFLDLTAMAERVGANPVRGADPLGLAMAAARAGIAAEVRPIVERIRQRAGAQPSEPMRRRLSHATALLCDDDSAERWFGAAIGGTGWPVEQALARMNYGAWLRRRRRPTEAREHLAEALAMFTGLGADPFVRATRIELLASGGSSEGEEAPAGALLSAQQLQIAALAAQGKRNHEIADELQLSPRTVSSHLHNAYLRLGITRRDELRRALAEHPTRRAPDALGVHGGDRQ